jgi:hypothetical protein
VLKIHWRRDYRIKIEEKKENICSNFSPSRRSVLGVGRRIAVRSGSVVGFGRGYGCATRELGTPLWTPH